MRRVPSFGSMPQPVLLFNNSPSDYMKDFRMLPLCPKKRILFRNNNELQVLDAHDGHVARIDLENFRQLDEAISQFFSVQQSNNLQQRETAMFWASYCLYRTDTAISSVLLEAMMHFVDQNFPLMSHFGIWTVLLFIKWCIFNDRMTISQRLAKMPLVNKWLYQAIERIEDDQLDLQYALLTVVQVLVFSRADLQYRKHNQVTVAKMDFSENSKLRKFARNCALMKDVTVRKVGFYVILIGEMDSWTEGDYQEAGPTRGRKVMKTTGVDQTDLHGLMQDEAIMKRHLLFDKQNADMLHSGNHKHNNQEIFRKCFMSWCWFKIYCALQSTENGGLETLVLAQFNQIDMLYSRTLLQTLKMFIASSGEDVVKNLISAMEKIICKKLFPSSIESYKDVDEEFLHFIDKFYHHVPNGTAWQSVYTIPE